MSHTVGSHSDDRGGEADLPCYCDVTPPPEESTLREKEFLNRVDYFYLQTDGTHDFPNSREGDLLKMAYEVIKNIKALVQERERLARIDEMKQLKKYDEEAFGKDKIVLSYRYAEERLKELKGKS